MNTAGMNVSAHFSLEEAFALLNRIVSPKGVCSPEISDLGVVVGLLTLNEEPELIVKRLDALEQLNRDEFEARFIVEAEEL